MTTLIVLIFLIIVFVSIWYIMKPSSKKKWPEPSKDVKYVKPEEKPIEHKCKYCGAMTTQPDSECFKAPKKYVRFRSMTWKEQFFYNIKPNLQFWYDLYNGELPSVENGKPLPINYMKYFTKHNIYVSQGG